MAYGFDPEGFDQMLQELGRGYKPYRPTRYQH